MPNKKTFPLADILSVTTGVLMSRHTPPIGGVYEVLNFVCEDNLFTHQLPRAAEQATPVILNQLPFLTELLHPPRAAAGQPKDVQLGVLFAWLEAAETKCGAEHELTSGITDYRPVNPIAEFQQMAPGKPIIGVAVGSDED